eukprot:6320745-Pyramimonas_sp.AAC.1
MMGMVMVTQCMMPMLTMKGWGSALHGSIADDADYAMMGMSKRTDTQSNLDYHCGVGEIDDGVDDGDGVIALCLSTRTIGHAPDTSPPPGRGGVSLMA